MQMCLSTANTEVTHRARWACCGPTHTLPGKMQMLAPQPHKLQHVHIEADTKVRLSWKEGKGPWLFYQ